MTHSSTQTPETAKSYRWLLTTTLLIFLFGSLHHIDHLVKETMWASPSIQISTGLPTAC